MFRNRDILLGIAMLIAAMEEARARTIQVEAIPTKAPGKKTEIKILDNVTLLRGASRYVYSSNKKGTLHEALIIADSPNFRVVLSVDKTLMLDASWSEINAVTQELTDITAFRRLTGDYVFRISNVSWLKSSYLIIVATDRITINKAVAKYEEEAS